VLNFHKLADAFATTGWFTGVLILCQEGMLCISFFDFSTRQTAPSLTHAQILIKTIASHRSAYIGKFFKTTFNGGNIF